MFWTLIIYGLAIFVTGFYYYTRETSEIDHIIGRRASRLSVISVSAQVSSLCLFILVFLPLSASAENGLFYTSLAAVCMTAGFILNQLLVASRLRVYSELSGNSKTLPGFFEHRFSDNTGVLRALSAACIMIFYLLLAASAINISTDILCSVSGYDRTMILIITCLFVSIYLFLGGFSAMTRIDMGRGVLLLAYIVFVFIFVLKPGTLENAPEQLGTDVLSGFINIFSSAGTDLDRILTAVGCLVMCFGFPDISVRFMATKERRIFKRFPVGTLLFLVSVSAAALFSGRAAFVLSAPNTLANAGEFYYTLFSSASPIIGAVFVSIVFVVLFSAVDASVRLASVSLSHDLIANASASNNFSVSKKLFISRLCLPLTALAAVLLALLSPDGIIPISFLLSLIASAFGPVTLFSLYLRFLTAKGAVVSFAGGILTAVFIRLKLGFFVSGFTLAETVPAFAVGTALLFIVSALDRKKPSARVLNEFGRAREINKMR